MAEYRRACSDKIEVYKYIHMYDQQSLSANVRLQQRPSRKYSYQLAPLKPKDGVRGPQRNSFYFRINQTWNDLPRNVVITKNMNAMIIII